MFESMLSVAEPYALVLFFLATVVALVPAVLFAVGRRPSPFPFLALTGMFYAIFFAIPPFLIDRRWWATSHAGFTQGIFFDILTVRTGEIVAGGVIALVAGYWIVHTILPDKVRTPVLGEVDHLRLRVFLWVAVVFHLLFLYVPQIHHVSSLAQAMGPLGLFAVGLLFVEMLRSRLSVFERLGLLVLVIPAEIVAYLIGGLITPIILLILYLATLYVFCSGRVWTTVAVMLVCVVVVFPLLKTPKRAIKFVTSAPGHYSLPETPMEFLARRMSLVVTLQRCVELTPSHVPYWRGATLANLITDPIPRFLWPNKPKEVMGQTFGHRYRLIGDGDMVTSMNLPWLIEFYINFGLLGVFVGMAIVGAVMAILEKLLLRREMTDLQIIAGWALIFPLVYQASNISLMVGGLPSQAVFMMMVVLLIAILCRARRPKLGC